ncbi:MAG: hypothetical protein ACYS8Y_10785 [Planctomycetota bacterium]|jgi:hypothetical protein
MNKKQLVTMSIGITLFVLSLLFPPWLVYEETLPPKPEWVYDKQKREFIPPTTFAASGYYFDSKEKEWEWKPNTYIPPSSMEWVKEELDRLSLEDSDHVLGYSLSDIKRVVKTDYISVLQAPYAKVVGWYANVGYDSNVIVGYPNDACGAPAYGSSVTVGKKALISKAYEINYFYLGLQLIIVTLLSGGLIITFRDKKPKDERKQ